MFQVSGRLSLGFDSPITAGLTFGCLLPWAYFLFKAQRSTLKYAKIWRGLGFILMVMGSIALVLTQSRGPLLSLFAGVYIATRFGIRQLHRAVLRKELIIAAGIVLLILVALPVGHRLSPSVVLSDLSIRHRLSIWSSASSLLTIKPLTGIGDGEAGYIFSQWFESDLMEYLYTGIFNVYLQVGVERGMPLMAGMIAFVLLLMRGFETYRLHLSTPVPLPLEGLAVTCAYMSAMTFFLCALTTVFHEPYGLCVILIVDIAILSRAFIGTASWRDSLKNGLNSLIISIAVVFVICAISFFSVPKNFIISVGPDHAVVLSKPKENNLNGCATIIIDRSKLGSLYGKTIRKWLRNSNRFDKFIIADPRFPLPKNILSSSTTIVMIGRASQYYGSINFSLVKEVVFIHPDLCPPKDKLRGKVSVWLPLIDEPGVSSRWRAASSEEPINFYSTDALGSSLAGLSLRL